MGRGFPPGAATLFARPEGRGGRRPERGEHHAVDHERVLAGSEQLRKADVCRLATSCLRLKDVVLRHDSAGRQLAAWRQQLLPWLGAARFPARAAGPAPPCTHLVLQGTRIPICPPREACPETLSGQGNIVNLHPAKPFSPPLNRPPSRSGRGRRQVRGLHTPSLSCTLFPCFLNKIGCSL